MRKIVYLTAAILAVAMTAPVHAQTASAPAPAGATAPTRAMDHRDHHPEIHHAMHALENTKKDLESARHDYGGHRAKALEHVNAALDELHQAMIYVHDEHK